MTRISTRIFISSILAVSMLLLGSLSLAAQESASPMPTFTHAEYFGVSAPLRELAKLPQPAEYGFHDTRPVHWIATPNVGHAVDTSEQGAAFPAQFAVGTNVPGVGQGFTGFSVPQDHPDANMAVGDTQLVQWVNTSLAVFDKTGNPLSGAILGNAIWQAGIPGTLCANNNSGDPIAQWDRLAHRWLLAQNVFVAPYAICVAVSQTPDALGPYYFYQFPAPLNDYPDYPKWGVWSNGGSADGYYQTMNNLGPHGMTSMGAEVCGYNRAKLLAGDPTAEQVCTPPMPTEDSLLPADVDSPTSPPSTQNEFFIGTLHPPNQLSLYSWDWSTGPATFSLPVLKTVNPYSGSCGGTFGGNCVPQLGTTNLLESRGDRLMYRFAYWNGKPPGCITCKTQYWLVNGDVESPNLTIGIRWYEFVQTTGVATPSTLAVFQQQTYAGTVATDMNYRWMGSIARDNANNILLGYSISNPNINPAIGFAGRLVSNTPPSQLSDEILLCNLGSCAYPLNNGGSQTGVSGWGQYTSMRIDPVDNCTFWYTSEYYMTTVAGFYDWSTQIASARFPAANCP